MRRAPRRRLLYASGAASPTSVSKERLIYKSARSFFSPSFYLVRNLRPQPLICCISLFSRPEHEQIVTSNVRRDEFRGSIIDLEISSTFEFLNVIPRGLTTPATSTAPPDYAESIAASRIDRCSLLHFLPRRCELPRGIFYLF